MDRRAFICLAPALALAGCATGSATSGGPKFSEAERKAITEYYAQQRALKPSGEKPAQGVRPGDKLAPGLRPGTLPGNLETRLPTLAAPHSRLVLGADVILVNRDTLDILDVIPQVAY